MTDAGCFVAGRDDAGLVDAGRVDAGRDDDGCHDQTVRVILVAKYTLASVLQSLHLVFGCLSFDLTVFD